MATCIPRRCDPPVCDRRVTSTRSRAANRLSSESPACSHTRITNQPLSRKRRDWRRSLSTFAASFSRHQAALDLGTLRCLEHPCQKHPSTNAQIRAPRNTTSAVQRMSRIGRTSWVKRKPASRSRALKTRSQVVSWPTFACMTCLTTEDVALGARALIDFTGLEVLRPRLQATLSRSASPDRVKTCRPQTSRRRRER